MIQSKKNREAIRTDKSVLNRSIFVVICVFLRVLQSETYFSDNHVTYYSLILHKNLPLLIIILIVLWELKTLMLNTFPCPKYFCRALYSLFVIVLRFHVSFSATEKIKLQSIWNLTVLSTDRSVLNFSISGEIFVFAICFQYEAFLFDKNDCNYTLGHLNPIMTY